MLTGERACWRVGVWVDELVAGWVCWFVGAWVVSCGLLLPHVFSWPPATSHCLSCCTPLTTSCGFLLPPAAICCFLWFVVARCCVFVNFVWAVHIDVVAIFVYVHPITVGVTLTIVICDKNAILEGRLQLIFY